MQDKIFQILSNKTNIPVESFAAPNEELLKNLDSNFEIIPKDNIEKTVLNKVNEKINDWRQSSSFPPEIYKSVEGMVTSRMKSKIKNQYGLHDVDSENITDYIDNLILKAKSEKADRHPDDAKKISELQSEIEKMHVYKATNLEQEKKLIELQNAFKTREQELVDSFQRELINEKFDYSIKKLPFNPQKSEDWREAQILAIKTKFEQDNELQLIDKQLKIVNKKTGSEVLNKVGSVASLDEVLYEYADKYSDMVTTRGIGGGTTINKNGKPTLSDEEIGKMKPFEREQYFKSIM